MSKEELEQKLSEVSFKANQKALEAEYLSANKYVKGYKKRYRQVKKELESLISEMQSIDKAISKL